jgi:tetratricopeptide (TPR) repeat protein
MGFTRLSRTQDRHTLQVARWLAPLPPSPPLPLLLLLLLLHLPHLAAPAPTYDALCESIVAHATAAAQAHNQGRDTASSIDAALGAFDAAVAVDPTEAQAYIYVANFLFNIHRFDASLERWRQALDRLRAARPQQPQYIAMVEGRIKETRFGDLSTRRDAVYADGQGNMTAAVALVERQLAMYRSPRILADLATLQSMLAEVHGAPTAAVSAQQFAAAQRAAAWGAAAFQRAQAGRGRGGKCPAAATLHDVDALSSATGSRGGSSGGGSGGSSEDLGGFRQVVVTSAGSSLPDVSTESAELERGLSAAYTARFAASAAASPSTSTATTTDTTTTAATTTTDVFIGALKKARLSGPDGVITRSKKCALHVYGTTEWPHVALHGSLWLGETWKSNAVRGAY